MSIIDLRSLIQALEAKRQVVHIKEKINPEPDVAQFAKAALADPEAGPALMFENLNGFSGQKMVMNTLASWKNWATAFDVDENTTVYEKYQIMEERWPKCAKGRLKFVDNAPCQEVIVEGDDINLWNYPVFRSNTGDGGMYIAKPAIVTVDRDHPDDINLTNIGMYRLQVTGPDTLGLQIMFDHDGASHLRKYEAAGENMPIAICVGAPPAVSSLACIPLDKDQSEFKYAAGLQGTTLKLAKTADGLPVPAYSEYILEGEVLCGVREPEGPFGEFPGTYSGVRNQCVVKVKRITHRTDPIWEELYLGDGHAEGNCMSNLITCISNTEAIRERMPDEIVAVNAMVAHGMVLIIAAKQPFGNFAKLVCYNAASSSAGIGHGKIIIVVDPWVDPFDYEQVLTKMSFRVRPDKDIIIAPYDVGMGLDPSNNPVGVSGRVFIDATTPVHPDHMRDVQQIEIDTSEKAPILKKLLAELREK